MIKIAVGGAQGRVGRCVVEATLADPETELVAAVIRPKATHNPESSAALNAPTSLNSINSTNSTNTSKTSANAILPTLGLAAVKSPFDVFIDFSSVASLDEHIKLCCERNQSMVIGITGLSQTQEEHLKAAAKIIPIVYSPNMSVGINLSFKLLEIAANVLKENVGVAIQEIHRQHKKDRPSGTALKMAEIITQTWDKTGEKDFPNSDISIASSRVADIMGEHTVLFALPEERLEITHKIDNRLIFAKGALRAAKWLVKRKPGLYDMQDVLSLKGQPPVLSSAFN